MPRVVNTKKDPFANATIGEDPYVVPGSRPLWQGKAYKSPSQADINKYTSAPNWNGPPPLNWGASSNSTGFLKGNSMANKTYSTGVLAGRSINKPSFGGSNTFDISQFQPDYQQTAAMMMDARNRGMTDNEIKRRFGNMGMNLNQMAGYQVLQDQSNSNTSFMDRTNQGLQDAYSNKNLIDRGSGIFEYADDPAKTEDETSWWSKIGKELGGIKGWIDL